MRVTGLQSEPKVDWRHDLEIEWVYQAATNTLHDLIVQSGVFLLIQNVNQHFEHVDFNTLTSLS